MDTRKKIGLYFGSFNPPHMGHMSVAIVALEDRGINLDEVWFVVSPHNPHKDAKSLCDENIRLEMVKLAISSMGEIGKKMFASNAEFDMSRPSYTIDTIRKIEKSNPDSKFFIIVGSDVFLKMPRWKEGAIIMRDCNIVVHMRPGTENFIGEYTNHKNIISMTDQPQVEISSTEVRERVKNGKTIGHMVPTAVASYIRENDLFIGDENGINGEVLTQGRSRLGKD